MKQWIPYLRSFVLVFGLVACDDSTDRLIVPEERFNDVSGNYSGVVVGVSQGVALDGVLSLSVAQDDSTITGSWALNGTLSDGGTTSVAQGGTFSGTVASGDDPPFDITLRMDACPHYMAQFSGSFDTTNRRLTATGPVDILDSACNIILTFPTNTFLNSGDTDLPAPGGDTVLPGGGVCATPIEGGADENGPPALDPGLFAVDLTLDASLDGIDDDGNLPISIEQVCDVPEPLASNAAQLVGGDGLVLLSADTRIRSCDDVGDSQCQESLLEDGALLSGTAATTALDNADTAILRVRLVPRNQWGTDEDGNAIPTFRAVWIKITD